MGSFLLIYYLRDTSIASVRRSSASLLNVRIKEFAFHPSI